ncbi:hypothetical protein PA0524 [Candidatus Phytoplasma australiense]|uniref:Uncharacterized protein n=2 Tax=Phytoplasma australiense TaxID=59748 RepID=B1VA85_PHYAS|nr:hypothetical protein [Candidatus Phytoplasma australiense]AGL90237.1 hypothetical protein SLY_0315 [Strawberry lethal yellows phytoplasma (CPA) str. NZSb11]CAM11858.1 hypothetical protein PA0524 [Candidatus Phytoplasma australiense]
MLKKLGHFLKIQVKNENKNLIQNDFHTENLKEKMSTDFTFILYGPKVRFLYLSAIMDFKNREI